MIRINLPLPDRILSPNARPHWAPKAKAVREARGAAYYLAMAAMRKAGIKPPKWEAAEVRTVFYWPTRHRRDRDNALASMKATMDGIADAGVVENDAGFIQHPPEMRHDPADPRVEITITERTP